MQHKHTQKAPRKITRCTQKQHNFQQRSIKPHQMWCDQSYCHDALKDMSAWICRSMLLMIRSEAKKKKNNTAAEQKRAREPWQAYAAYSRGRRFWDFHCELGLLPAHPSWIQFSCCKDVIPPSHAPQHSVGSAARIKRMCASDFRSFLISPC